MTNDISFRVSYVVDAKSLLIVSVIFPLIVKCLIPQCIVLKEKFHQHGR